MACYDSSPRLITCTFDQNATVGQGGGVYFRLSSPVFEGCIFTSNTANYGGGMAAAEGSSPTLTHCSFTYNTADDPVSWGGGAYFEASGGTLLNCSFRWNQSCRGKGGAMYISGGNPAFLNCSFIENDVPNGRGGGLYMISAMPSFSGCLFEGNVANRGGAAYVISDLGANVTDCKFVDNRAFSIGGAVAYENAGLTNLTRCVFDSNEAQSGAGVSSMGNSVPILANCTMHGCRGSAISISSTSADTARVQNSIIAFSPTSEAVTCNPGEISLTCTDIYANVGGNWTGCIASQAGQSENFSLDPLFCEANRDLTLRAASPCAPGNSPAGCGLIGALPVVCDVTDVADDAPGTPLKLTVIPNPVRGVARFDLDPMTPEAALSIFDAQGRVVEQLVGQDGHWTWTPGSAVPAGVYFARMSDGGQDREAIKFLYLR
jgi:hypothetical protein